MVTPESDLALAGSMSDRDVWIASPEGGPLVARVTPAELLVASAPGDSPGGGARSHIGQ